MGLTVHQSTRKRCGRCGTDPFATHGHCTRKLAERGEPQETEHHLCGPCACDLGSDERRDEYLRLGILV